MKFNIVSNLTNGVGLQRDYELLHVELAIRGHQVHGVQFNAPGHVPQADVNIFLEVVNPQIFSAAPVQWAVPNPEWWFTGWEKYKWDLILAKTKDCERIFTEKQIAPCRFVGWKARNLYDDSIPRERTFLHVAGKSRFKNTHAVVKGAALAGVPITIISEWHPPKRRLTDDQFRREMNRHMFHLLPSAYEGYGQALHEGLGVGQILLTTDAPPMNEVIPAFYIPSYRQKRHHSGILYEVTPEDVAAGIRELQSLTDEELETYSRQAREQFHADEDAFIRALDDLLQGVAA